MSVQIPVLPQTYIFIATTVFLLSVLTIFLFWVCLRPIFVPLRGERKRSRPTQVQEAAEPDAPIDSLSVNTCHAAATDSTKSSCVPSNPLLNSVSGTLWTPQCKTHWSRTTSREQKINTPRNSDNTAHPKSLEYVTHDHTNSNGKAAK